MSLQVTLKSESMQRDLEGMSRQYEWIQ